MTDTTQTLLTASADVLDALIVSIEEALADMPDDAIAEWLPQAATEDGEHMNRIGTILVHMASSGRWMLEQQVFGDEVPRDRDAEFTQTTNGTAGIQSLRDTLTWFRQEITRRPAPDLAAPPPLIRPNAPHLSTRMHFLLHTVDHWGLHTGQIQIQAQLYRAEQS